MVVVLTNRKNKRFCESLTDRISSLGDLARGRVGMGESVRGRVDCNSIEFFDHLFNWINYKITI